MGMEGCGQEKTIDIHNVPYVPCPCNEDMQLAELSFPQGEAYLFKDSVPIQREMQLLEEAYEGHVVKWIVFDSETGEANLSIAENAILNICEICNFPDFTKICNISINGRKVYFEGVTYKPCIPKGGSGTVSYFDYILTTLVMK